MARLAIHVANELLHEFPRGVYVVSLAPISDPKLVAAVIAQTFGLRASSDRTLLDILQRTQAVKADFLLTETNASIVADICTRLDGVPLAIELAATRMRLLSPQQLLVRLGQRLQVLTGGSRDLPARQQTLRSTIKWSYDLLNAEEQRLFQRLVIFVGGCSIGAVESVSESIILAIGEEPLNVLDACISLLDKQLIQQRQQSDGDSRLYMLETIREFALECLYASDKADLVGEAHTKYYQTFVEKSAPPVFDPKEMEWFDRLYQELDDVRGMALAYHRLGGA